MKIKPLNFPLKELFIKIFKDDVYLVGGTIRDHLLYDSLDKRQDTDLMVTGFTYNQIQRKLMKYGKTNTVGRSFAVVKFSCEGRDFDISVPRKDIKNDPDSHSHKNFIIDYGPHIPLEEDLGRRDFTCNSIAMRLIDNQIVDPFDGIRAIGEKRIVMTGPKTFADDPLRILRAARFASVHQFTVDENIYMCAKDVPLDELSKERIIEEWFRLLLESPRPSIGMQEYLKLTVLEKLFPPLYPLSLTIQDAIFHPEKDEYGHHTVWHHTLLALDVAKKAGIAYGLDEQQMLTLLLGILFHDVGKAVTTKWEFKKDRMAITSMFHDTKGAAITDEFFTQMKIENRKGFPLRETILKLVKGHLRIWELYRNREEVGFKAFSRLVRDMGGHDILLMLTDFADRQSREPEPLDFTGLDEVSQWYLNRKAELKVDVETVQPIVKGRDLISLGISPGVQMGEYLKQLYEKQLDGEFETLEQGLSIFKSSILPSSE